MRLGRRIVNPPLGDLSWFNLTVVALSMLVGIIAWADDSPNPVLPLPNAHAHNDYWHNRPLLDALDHGFTSVEADVFLHDGKLLVGHDLVELSSEKTLEALYLEPLRALVEKNGGQVYPVESRFVLFIDIKSSSGPTYDRLQSVLARYGDILTAVEEGEQEPRAITVVISGARPTVEQFESGVHYAGYDGRLSDLESKASAAVMPVISDRWPSHFRWDGTGEFPDAERERLLEIVDRVHSKGRLLRFWATPENEEVWEELLDAGVDLINTDELSLLSEHLRNR